jgi:predicted RNase H-like HicB family nuclease
MAKYAYPAIFTTEEDGSYSINFPDLEGCYTCGDTLEDGIEMAEDALALVLYGYEKDDREIPVPSKANTLSLSSENEFVNYIACDTLQYRKMYNNKAVKKTLTIPEWLNEAASSMGLNFSQVLQEALMQKIQFK